MPSKLSNNIPPTDFTKNCQGYYLFTANQIDLNILMRTSLRVRLFSFSSGLNDAEPANPQDCTFCAALTHNACHLRAQNKFISPVANLASRRRAVFLFCKQIFTNKERKTQKIYAIFVYFFNFATFGCQNFKHKLVAFSLSVCYNDTVLCFLEALFS